MPFGVRTNHPNGYGSMEMELELELELEMEKENSKSLCMRTSASGANQIDQNG